MRFKYRKIFINITLPKQHKLQYRLLKFLPYKRSLSSLSPFSFLSNLFFFKKSEKTNPIIRFSLSDEHLLKNSHHVDFLITTLPIFGSVNNQKTQYYGTRQFNQFKFF